MQRDPQSDCWTVHAFPAEPYGRSLISMLEELAVACGYGDPERHTTILKRCDMKLHAARLAARMRKACVWSWQADRATDPEWRPDEAR